MQYPIVCTVSFMVVPGVRAWGFREEATALLLEAYGEYAEVKSATYATSESYEADIDGHFKEIFLQAYFVENFDEMSESEKKILEDIVYDRLCAYNAGDEYVSLNTVKWLGEKLRCRILKNNPKEALYEYCEHFAIRKQ